MVVGEKIILAGVDGCGKSTLARKIQEDFASQGKVYEIVHSTADTRNNLTYFMGLLEDERNIIFDRFYVDQFVYQTSETRKEKDWLTLSDLVVVENKINQFGLYKIIRGNDEIGLKKIEVFSAMIKDKI